MYSAKRQGRNRYCYYTSDVPTGPVRRADQSSDLRKAISDGQFQVQYQPIINVRTGEVKKAEALVRWNHPAHGLLLPEYFLSPNDDAGLVADIDAWIIQQATAHAAEWTRNTHRTVQLYVHGATPLRRSNTGLCPQIVDQLISSSAPRGSIVVEVTEGLLTDAMPDALQKRLLTIREAGLDIAIDGFGGSAGSIPLLKKFGVSYLKLHGLFDTVMGRALIDRSVWEAIIAMAHKLEIAVIAEGVETAEQRTQVEAMGCDFAQGYVYSEPLPPDEFERLLAQQA